MAHGLVDAEAAVDVFLDGDVTEVGVVELGELEDEDDELDDFIVSDGEVEHVVNTEREEAVQRQQRGSKRVLVEENDEDGEVEEASVLHAGRQGADLNRKRGKEKNVRNVRQRRTCAVKGGRVLSAEEEVQADCHVRDDIANSGADEDLFDLICECDELRKKSVVMEEGEALCGVEEDDGGDREPVDVDKIISQQRETLVRRNCVVMPRPMRQDAHSRVSIMFAGSTGGMRVTKAERWMETLEILPEDFFSSAEARLKETEKVKRGLSAYNGVPINESNSEDMARIYETSFLSKIQLGQPRGAYDQFKTTTGQFVRMCISLRLADRLNFYKKGQLFVAIANMKAVQAFTSYFQIRSSSGTVCGKSRHLGKLASHAEIYFSGREDEMKGRVGQVREFLLSCASAHKTFSRLEARKRRNFEERLERMVLLLPADFDRLIGECTKELKDMVRTCGRWFRRGNRASLFSRMIETKGFISKWCLYMIALCVLMGGGQRPQVYGQLQVPSMVDIKEMEMQAKNHGFFELKTILEKTLRSSDIPNVIFPALLLNYVKFHARIVRPAILKKLDICIANPSLRNESLLIDTRNGYPLQSRSVTASVRRFLCSYDPELSNVTPMSIRASYATMMVDRYQKRRILRDRTEEQFLDFLSKMMNTSIEHLRSTYISTRKSEYLDVARELVSVFQSQEDREKRDMEMDPCEDKDGSNENVHQGGGNLEQDLFSSFWASAAD